MLRAPHLSDVKEISGFWGEYLSALANGGLQHQWRMILETGRLDNFLIAAGKKSGKYRGLRFDDSDIYKWIEATALVLAHHSVPELGRAMDEAIEAVIAAQEPDGYLNTYYTLVHPEQRWRQLANSHEIYCAGHLFEAAATMKMALGDERLIPVARKFADLILSRSNTTVQLDGHPEAEIGLISLADATGEEKYRELAERMTRARGSRPSLFETELSDPEVYAMIAGASALFYKGEGNERVYSGEYAQDHKALLDHDDIVGHSVRAAYLYAAGTRIAAEQKDEALLETMRRVWTNTTERRMYITGGIGSSARNEGFTSDYDLPNRDAYAETCAACGLVFWGAELMNATGEGEYAEIIERALYNGVLSGISPDTKQYFYENPLESHGEHERQPWYLCACCPPNVARTIGRIGQYAFSVDDPAREVRVHFPIAARLEGEGFSLAIDSAYPESGKSIITVRNSGAPLRLLIRIPDWAQDVEIDAPDELGEADFDRGYAAFAAIPEGETKLTVDTPMPPVLIAADARVLDNAGRIAASAGPTIFCAVEASTEEGYAPQHLMLETEPEVEWGGGALELPGMADLPAEPVSLYSPYEPGAAEEVSISLVPYRNWADRGATRMQVWLRRLD